MRGVRGVHKPGTHLKQLELGLQLRSQLHGLVTTQRAPGLMDGQ